MGNNRDAVCVCRRRDLCDAVMQNFLLGIKRMRNKPKPFPVVSRHLPGNALIEGSLPGMQQESALKT